MKRIIFLIISLVTVFFMNAQESTSFINRTPDFLNISTPNATSFNRFVDNSVSLYTGTPDISVPIYNLKDGVIDLPFVLRYNNSGIKVDEEASWVGLGWNLNVGGVITQNIVGDYDEIDQMYNTILEKMNINENNWINSYANYSYNYEFHKKLQMYLGDSYSSTAGKLTPDVFYYSYPGGSGRFFFDYRSNNIYMPTRENGIQIYVSKRVNNSIREFKIQTEEGVLHTFEFLSKYGDVNKPRTPSTITYILTSSLYPNQQIIQYKYSNVPINRQAFSESCQMTLPPGDSKLARFRGDKVYNYGRQYLEGFEFYLKEIITTNYKVSFLTSNRIDIESGKKLDKIKIEHNDNTTFEYFKEFKFDYDYFNASTGYKTWMTDAQILPDYITKRLKLLSVYELQGNNKNNKYDFKYNSKALPPKYSYSVDYWGYSNGEKNNTLIPNPEYLWIGYRSIDSYKSAIETAGMSLSHSSGNKVMFANRGYDFENCIAAILTEIKYPTGGRSVFKYEPNSFIYSYLPTKQEISKRPWFVSTSVSDNNSPTQTTCYTFTLKEKTDINLTLYITRGFNYWSQMQNSFVTVVHNPTGTTFKVIKEYKFSPSYDSNSQTLYEKITLEAGTYLICAALDDAIGNQNGASLNHGEVNVGIQFYRGEYTKGLHEVEGCGVRIKSINHYQTDDDSIPIITTYEYKKSKNELTSGILQDIPQYGKIHYNTGNLLQVGNGEPINGIPQKFLVPLDILNLAGSNSSNDPYNSGSSVGYSYVKESKTIDENELEYTERTFYNEDPINSDMSIRLTDPLNGKLDEVKMYNSQKGIVFSEKYSYSKVLKRRYYGVNFYDKLNMFPGIFSVNSGSGISMIPKVSAEAFFDNGYFDGRMSIILHRLNSYNIALASKTWIKDNVTKIEEYIYNEETMQMREKKIKTSNDKEIKYTYSYANDFSCDIYRQMLDNNLLKNVIEEKVFNDKGLVASTVTEYAWDRNHKFVIPTLKYFSEISSKLTNPTSFSCNGVNTAIYPYENIQYKEYDPYCNPIYIVKDNATHLIYLWSYTGQYPVAEIKNTSYADVNSALATVGLTSMDALSASTNPDKTKLDKLRTLPILSNAMITTYKYQPLIGMLESTDPSGITTYYEYDVFSRLKRTYIKDQSGKDQTVQSYDYHYQNQ